jgi:multidrug efflux pump subunit AcrA (membrane-fusion protein)
MRPAEAAPTEEERDRSAAPARRDFWTDPQNGNQYFVALEQDDESPTAEAAGTAKGVQVTVAEAKRAERRVETRQPATLMASREAEVRSRVAGVVAECNVETGDRVKKGELRLAAAQHKAAGRRLERSRLSGQQRRITVPFDGVVSEVNVDVGSFVRGPAETKPLFVVTTTERVVAVVQVAENDAVLLDRGNPATVEINALPGR